jgi:hypothetical protein
MADNVVESSVQQKNKADYWQQLVLRFAQNYDAIPDWWSPERDRYFRKYWTQEPFLASTIYAIANRNAAYGWELTGIDEDVNRGQQMLQFADFGEGWQSFITKFSIDYLTQDNGAFVEVIRPARVKVDGKYYHAFKNRYENDVPQWYYVDDGKTIALRDKAYKVRDIPMDLPVGIAHLDSGRCQRTGDPDTPVIYTDRNNKRHFLKWWQVLCFNEMPSPIEEMNGVGYSALTRVFRASHIMQSISIYNDEKIGGRFNREIYLTNVDADLINDALLQQNESANNAGLLRYTQPIVLDTLKPDATPAVVSIPLASVPDNFDADTMQNWYIANLALALGVDYGFLAPLPGKGLGTASQSETMKRQSKGKSSRLFMDSVSNALNFKGVLPEAVQFNFIERDVEEEKQETDAQKSYVDMLKTLIETGMVTPTVARQMAADKNIIAVTYIEMLGEEDETPVVNVEGDENLETQQEIQEQSDEMQENDVEQIVNQDKLYTIKDVKQAQKKLFETPTFIERAKNAARKAFGKKEIETLETENETLNVGLQRYANLLEPLVLQALNSEITKAEFIQQMQNVVSENLTAFYVEFSGLEPDEFTAQDEANLEEQLAINFDSINDLADDIYAGKYEDTEERDGTLILLGRMALWTTKAAELAWIALLNNPDKQEQKLMMVLNPQKENCETCIALDGQIHTVSEWAQSGWHPQHPAMICGGWRCGCEFSDVPPDTPSRGSFANVPTK